MYLLLSDYIAENHLLSENQWGFQAKKGTVSALLLVSNDLFRILDSGTEVCAVFFDFKKAFDFIPHQKLISVLKCSGINPALHHIICSYLTGRTQSVVVDGACSDSVPVVSGVPQGSVLGPLLFLLYINTIFDVPLSPGSKIIMYADNLLLYRQMNSVSDYDHIQHCVNLLSNWSSENHLTFNPTKCKTMLFSRKRSHVSKSQPLFLGDSQIELVHLYRYLGVTLVSDISWSEQIESICVKARS